MKCGNAVLNPFDSPNSLGRELSYDILIEPRSPYMTAERRYPPPPLLPNPMNPAPYLTPTNSNGANSNTVTKVSGNGFASPLVASRVLAYPGVFRPNGLSVHTRRGCADEHKADCGARGRRHRV